MGGSSLPAVRVELNPAALYKYGIGARGRARRDRARPTSNRPKGSVEDGERHWQILANDQAKKAAEYLPLIVAYAATAPPVRLSDVAEVVDSVQDLQQRGLGQRQALGAADHQPPAQRQHHRDRRPRCKALLPLLRRLDPERRSTSTVVLDRTPTIRALAARHRAHAA